MSYEVTWNHVNSRGVQRRRKRFDSKEDALGCAERMSKAIFLEVDGFLPYNEFVEFWFIQEMRHRLPWQEMVKL